MPLGTTGSWGASGGFQPKPAAGGGGFGAGGGGATVGAQMEGLRQRPQAQGTSGRATFGGMSLRDEVRARNEAGGGGGGSQQGSRGHFNNLTELKNAANSRQIKPGDKFKVDVGGTAENWMAFKPEDMMSWDENTLKRWGAQNFGMGQWKFDSNKELREAYKRALEQYT